MVNDWWDVRLWVGIRGGRDNRLCCLWYLIGLGVRGSWVSMFDVFWVLFGVLVLGGGFFFLASGFHCVCVCVCVQVVWRIWCIYRRKKNILTNVKECREGKLIYGMCLCFKVVDD